jgi:hypothetical protein
VGGPNGGGKNPWVFVVVAGDGVGDGFEFFCDGVVVGGWFVLVGSKLEGGGGMYVVVAGGSDVGGGSSVVVVVGVGLGSVVVVTSDVSD